MNYATFTNHGTHKRILKAMSEARKCPSQVAYVKNRKGNNWLRVNYNIETDTYSLSDNKGRDCLSPLQLAVSVSHVHFRDFSKFTTCDYSGEYYTAKGSVACRATPKLGSLGRLI